MVSVGPLEPANVSPVWKIDRAVIERVGPMIGQPRLPAERMLILKLSLRNEGGPGNLPVRIMGRWMVQPPRPFTLLGTYTQEVTFKQSVVLEVQLFPLFVPPAQAPAELSIMTGDLETDRQQIRMPE
jgi:hypothetical protein